MAQPKVHQHDPRPDGLVEATIRGEMEGFADVEVTLTCDVRRLAASLQYLRAQGLRPARSRLTFERTAEGHPICPRHHVPMRLRDKQGDEWYSHKVTSAEGTELYCRGYPGPSSPGYDVLPEGETPPSSIIPNPTARARR